MNMRHGRGIKKYKSGRIYDGMWKHDRKTKEATVTYELELNDPKVYMSKGNPLSRENEIVVDGGRDSMFEKKNVGFSPSAIQLML